MLDLTIGNGHLYLFCNPVLLTNIYAVDSNKIPFSTSCSATWNKAVHCWMSIARSLLTAGGRPGIQQPVAVHFVSAIAPFSLVHAAGRRILVCVVPWQKRTAGHPIGRAQREPLTGVCHDGRSHALPAWRSPPSGATTNAPLEVICQDKYQLVAGEDQELFISKLSMKSQVPESAIRDILDNLQSFKDRLSLKEKR